MTIRGIRPGDRAALLRLAAEVFSGEELPVAHELIGEAAAGCRDYRVLLAEGGDRGDREANGPEIAGYVCYGPTPMTTASYDLYWIGCHPRARGRGLASALIRAMEDDIRASGGAAVRVETEDGPEYAAARRLYERLEYPRVAHLPDFYRPGAGLIIYYKRLP
jgi:ribosomal protein S18 acetylase RimI-like enzyme